MRWWPALIVAAIVSLLTAEPAANPWHRDKPVVHVVYPGQTLGMIAKRYNVSIKAICVASGISRSRPIRPKQRLIIPASDDKSGKQAAELRARGKVDKRRSGVERKENRSARRRGTARRAETNWRRYARPAPRRGYVILVGTAGSWRGYAIVKGNKISDSARRGFKKTLASWRTGESLAIDSRLIRLLTRVSDTFGGRPLRIVSGFRRHSYSRESRHKFGRAVDFAVVGVPNSAVRDYIKTLGNVGVGYYPNSSFVHLDVRNKSTTWVDYSGPGEAPRYAHAQRKRRAEREKRATHKDSTPPTQDKSPEPAAADESESRDEGTNSNDGKKSRDTTEKHSNRSKKRTTGSSRK